MILGELGIDSHLILAQAVNFGILTFVLYRFVYKPIYKKIEDDEAKLKEAETKIQKLNQKELELNKKDAEEDKKIKEKSENILAEAEDIAKNLRERTLEKAQLEADEILKLAKLEVKNSEGEQKDANKDLVEIFNDEKVYTQLEKIFFERLMEQLRKIFVKYTGSGEIVLETAHPLQPGMERQVKEFLERYVGDDAHLKVSENKDLIVGFRLLSGKAAIDQNLLYEINND